MIDYNKIEDPIIREVARGYNLDLENPPDINNPEVSRAIDEEIAEQCKPIFNAYARAETALWGDAHTFPMDY